MSGGSQKLSPRFNYYTTNLCITCELNCIFRFGLQWRWLKVAVEVGAAVVFVTANQLLILVTWQSVNSAL